MRRPRFRPPRPRAELTCWELVRLVTDYLEGHLSATERRRFDAHIAHCDGCTTYLAQMRDTIRIAGAITEESLAPEARDELLVAFRSWKDGRG